MNSKPETQANDEASILRLEFLHHEVRRLKRRREGLDLEIAQTIREVERLTSEKLNFQQSTATKGASSKLPDARPDW